MEHRIVIKRHRPWLRAALIAGFAALIAVAGFALYLWARTQTIQEFRQAKTELEQLQDERRDLAKQLRTALAENADLRQQIAYAKQSTEIDGAACTELKASLGDVQAEAADLREQVAFYRGIVSPDETHAGVRVLDLKLTPQTDPLLWRYDLVLIQSVRHDKRVAGTARARLIGSRNGQEAQLDLASLLVEGGALPQFAFKYFQEFSGEFKLPAGFRPLRVAVTLAIDGEAAAVENEFDWSKIQVKKAP